MAAKMLMQMASGLVTLLEVVELERDASAALTKIVGSYYVGVAEIEDARAVQIISDF